MTGILTEVREILSPLGLLSGESLDPEEDHITEAGNKWEKEVLQTFILAYNQPPVLPSDVA